MFGKQGKAPVKRMASGPFFDLLYVLGFVSSLVPQFTICTDTDFPPCPGQRYIAKQNAWQDARQDSWVLGKNARQARQMLGKVPGKIPEGQAECPANARQGARQDSGLPGKDALPTRQMPGKVPGKIPGCAARMPGKQGKCLARCLARFLAVQDGAGQISRSARQRSLEPH